MKIICDTHALIYYADGADRLSTTAKAWIEKGKQNKQLACSDMSLWEIGMLLNKGRLNQYYGSGIEDYISDIIDALHLTVLPITPRIAELAQSSEFMHGDPADRIIAATAISHNATLITADGKLQQIKSLKWAW